MILSDKSLVERLIEDREQIEEVKAWWERGEWEKVGNKILIYPFDSKNLGPCSYDLTVGEEYISLRNPENTRPLEKEQPFDVGPGETVLILTEEYICLPQNIMGMIVPRASWIAEGTSLCATRIDPTWYGKLLIGFTNMGKNPINLCRGDRFCTCYFQETFETRKAVTQDQVKFLGRTKIGRVLFTYTRPTPPLPAEKVTLDDLEHTVDRFGTPWDIVRGVFVLSQRELQNYIDKDVAPNVIEEATSQAYKRAFEIQQRWFATLVIGGLTLLAGFVALLGYLLHLLLSRP